MNVLFKTLLLGICLLSALRSAAQKKLVEGNITYKAVVTNPDGSTKDGTYIISVKNKQIRKDLKLGTDFENIMICDNTEKLYTLKSVKEKNFAIEMSVEDYSKRNEKYDGATVKNTKETKTIAGIKTQNAIIQYQDGSTTNVYYTTEWITDAPHLFERFEQLNGLPLAFDYKSDQGVVINFEATSLDENVVENAKFKVPAGYKIISNDEYKDITSK